MAGTLVVDGLLQPVADQLSLRRSNLSLVLRHLSAAGPRSRARIAQETGLTKATVSSLVGELAERGLVRDGDLERGALGRPGYQVEVRGSGACGIGIEVNVDYVAAMVVDLAGRVVSSERLSLDGPRVGPIGVLDQVARLVERCCDVGAAESGHVAGVTIALPGGVDIEQGTLTYAPNLGWREVPVVTALAERLQRGVTLRVDNEANLAALGEYRAGSAAGTPDLLLLTGEVGVGGGVIAGGRLLRGGRGYGGEVGHMLLDPKGEICGCGRRGCWETLVGLGPLLRAAAGPGDPLRDPTTDLDRRLDELTRRATALDARTLAALEQVGTWLGIGASLLVNVLNPSVLVLGGYFARMGPWLVEPVRRELTGHVVAPAAGGCRVEISTLAFSAAVRGGALTALEAVLDDPTSVGATARAVRAQTTTAGA